MNSAPAVERPRTPRHLWGRLIALLVPAALLWAILKLVRIQNFFPGAGALQTAAMVSSDIAFGAAWVLLWSLGCLLARGRMRTIVFYAAHVATAVVGLYAVFNHEYMMRTGNPLAWTTIVDALSLGGEVEALVGSQVSVAGIGLLVGVTLGVTVVPLVFGPFLSKLFTRAPKKKIKAAGVVALVGFVLAATWTSPTASAAFSLAAPVQLAITPMRASNAYPAELASETVLATPETTTLVGNDGEPRNLVIITLESQRSAATLQDVSQPVTPVIDALMETSIAPERGYTVMPHTSKALTAIHCGITPPLDRANTEADPGSLPAKCLPDLLAEQGYSTSFFQSATEKFERRRKTAANLGFQDFMSVDQMDSSGFNRANYFGYEDEIMLEPERAWLEDNGDEPFMLSMLTVTGHHDYALTGYPTIDFVEDPLLNSYLNGIHYQDQFVGKVFDMFKEMGLYENTVFVITGDHGEGFGEHLRFQHDNTIYEEGIRIPMLIHDPSRDGQIIDGAANQTAILPTVVDLLGFELETDAEYQPSLISGEAQGLVIATCYTRGKCTSIIDGDLKLIHHFDDRRDEVFNVALDPHETNDLIEQTDAAWVAEMRDTALAWYLDTENSYAAYRDN